MLHNRQDQASPHHSLQCHALTSSSSKPTLHWDERNAIKSLNHGDLRLKAMREEKILTNYPSYSWELLSDQNKHAILKPQKTISRHLIAYAGAKAQYEGQLHHICPYGDQPAKIAILRFSKQPQVIRNAYALSALRFKLSPFEQTKSTKRNHLLGIPTVLQNHYSRLSSIEAHSNCSDLLFQQHSWTEFSNVLRRVQHQAFFRYINDVVPHMNANPFDPEQHAQTLSGHMIHSLKQYVELQNRPLAFFDLMQWIERDVATLRWKSFFQAGRYLSIESAMILVMKSWRDRGGERRKKPIHCPVGVPIGYMQSIRRKNQPFISPEFAGHAHGALNHWLQEHVWQRFYARHPEKCRLAPSDFFKALGYMHFAFADSIYELHMPNVVNPANTNFWSVLQCYLPLMSPWP